MANNHADSARPAPGPSPLSKLGPYLVLTKLAPGPVATAYLCRKGQDTGPGGLYQVTVVHEDLGSYPWLVERLLAEVALSARIAHPNVEVISDFGTTDDHSFVATRFVEGSTLAQMTSRQIDVPARIVIPLIVDVLRGLHAAHSLRDERGNPTPIVHSGVAPASIYVGLDGVARVTEFGIARVQMRTTQTMPGVRSDRFAHLSPEQIGQAGEIDARADIFAVGTVLWSLLTSRPLFRAADAVATMHQVLHMQVPSTRSTGIDVPFWLDEICLRALHKPPHLRYASADQMAAALEERAIKNKLWAGRAEIADWARRALAAEPKFSVLSTLGRAATTTEDPPPMPAARKSSSLFHADELVASGARARSRRRNVLMLLLLGMPVLGVLLFLLVRHPSVPTIPAEPTLPGAQAPAIVSASQAVPEVTTPPAAPHPDPSPAQTGASARPSTIAPAPVLEPSRPSVVAAPRPKVVRAVAAPTAPPSPHTAAIATPTAEPATPTPLPSLESNPYLRRAVH